MRIIPFSELGGSAGGLEHLPKDLPSRSASFREIDGLKITWQEPRGFRHAVEGSKLFPGQKAYWTLCQRDVENGLAYLAEDYDEVTCVACRNKLAADWQMPTERRPERVLGGRRQRPR